MSNPTTPLSDDRHRDQPNADPPVEHEADQYDDLDVAWTLSRTDGVVRLKRTHA
jgi:hypothetical protein